MLRIAQIGIRHGHAAGKWRSLRSNPEVDAVGIWEPDRALRHDPRFTNARWFESAAEVLDDATIEAVVIEGSNSESLGMAEPAIAAGKHLWFDKPAGEDWAAFQRVMDAAARQKLYVQMGYMFRYSPGFGQIEHMVKSEALGAIFAIRAHMSTSIDLAQRTAQMQHLGGILYDLAGHMIDQIVWLLGKPTRSTTFLRNDNTPELPAYSDNTVCVLEFERALAMIDIAAMEPRPTARVFEVYGTRGSVILERFDPARRVRVVIDGAERYIELPIVERQGLYDRELAAFVGVLRGERPPDRSPEHELLVQEVLLRGTGRLKAGQPATATA
jgi:predicted dehydrogenase